MFLGAKLSDLTLPYRCCRCPGETPNFYKECIASAKSSSFGSADLARLIDSYKTYLLKRWDQGCRKGAQLEREVRAKGYKGAGSK